MSSAKSDSLFRARCAAILGLLAVLLVPVLFSHLTDEKLSSGMETASRLTPWKFWNTALIFQLIHAVLLYFLAEKSRKDVWWALFLGIIAFSGGIYLNALTGIEYFGMMSQIGLLTLVLAWGVLAFGGRSAQ